VNAPTGPLRIAFAFGEGHAGVFDELVTALRAELGPAGVDVHAGESGRRGPGAGAAGVRLLLSTAAAGSESLEVDARTAAEERLGVVTTDRAAAASLSAGGLAVHHLHVGFAPWWACDPQTLAAERDIDVLHLGTYSHRRSAALARYAPHLARWRSHIALPAPDAPGDDPDPTYVSGRPKWELLRRSRVVLDVRMREKAGLDWVRVAHAISNGVAVVTEHAHDLGPLVPGVHLECAAVNAVALVAQELLEDEERRLQMTRAAYETLRDTLPLRHAAARLAAFAWTRAAAVPGATPPAARAARGRPPAAAGEGRFPSDVLDADVGLLRATLKDVRLQALAHRRQIAGLNRLAHTPALPPVERAFQSAGYAAARPRVTVAVPALDERRRLAGALESCAAQTLRDLEIVVVDDGSADGSAELAAEWCELHPEIPSLVVRHAVNRGAGSARNTAVDFARAPFTFMLDADNRIFPRALARLSETLRERPGAAFAYSMLATVEGDVPVDLRSRLSWDPRRLRTGNYIDAMGLWRTSDLRDLGGYSTDMRLYGWEDYDLICRLAERGGAAVQVPEILGTYEQRPGSMLSLTDISTSAAVATLVERHPTVMHGVVPPL
jgi:hypothetical protein